MSRTADTEGCSASSEPHDPGVKMPRTLKILSALAAVVVLAFGCFTQVF